MAQGAGSSQKAAASSTSTTYPPAKAVQTPAGHSSQESQMPQSHYSPGQVSPSLAVPGTGTPVSHSATEASTQAAHGSDAHPADHDKPFDINEMIFHHIQDANEFHVVGDFSIPLPCILYHPQEGLSVFLSNKFEHGHKEVNGYNLVHGVVERKDKSKFYDFSITKNVFTMLLGAAILLFVFLSVAGAYTRRKGQAPKGLQGFMEPLIVFIRDEVAKPNIPTKWEKYLHYLMTIFFFILILNLLGLIPFWPGGANTSGNIAFTAVLATFTFLVMVLSGNKHFWGHTFWMPGVPIPLKPFLGLIEVAGLFIKPVSLALRLFANITGGHILVLSLVGLIFIFGKAGQSAGGAAAGAALSVPFTLFISAIELLVAFLQAFIFTMLSALYIGMAVDEGHAHEENRH